METQLTIGNSLVRSSEFNSIVGSKVLNGKITPMNAKKVVLLIRKRPTLLAKMNYSPEEALNIRNQFLALNTKQIDQIAKGLAVKNREYFAETQKANDSQNNQEDNEEGIPNYFVNLLTVEHRNVISEIQSEILSNGTEKDFIITDSWLYNCLIMADELIQTEVSDVEFFKDRVLTHLDVQDILDYEIDKSSVESFESGESVIADSAEITTVKFLGDPAEYTVNFSEENLAITSQQIIDNFEILNLSEKFIENCNEQLEDAQLREVAAELAIGDIATTFIYDVLFPTRKDYIGEPFTVYYSGDPIELGGLYSLLYDCFDDDYVYNFIENLKDTVFQEVFQKWMNNEMDTVGVGGYNVDFDGDGYDADNEVDEDETYEEYLEENIQDGDNVLDSRVPNSVITKVVLNFDKSEAKVYFDNDAYFFLWNFKRKSGSFNEAIGDSTFIANDLPTEITSKRNTYRDAAIEKLKSVVNHKSYAEKTQDVLERTGNLPDDKASNIIDKKFLSEKIKSTVSQENRDSGEFYLVFNYEQHPQTKADVISITANGKRGSVGDAEKYCLRVPLPDLPQGTKYKNNIPLDGEGDEMTNDSIRTLDGIYSYRGYTDSEFSGTCYYEVVFDKTSNTDEVPVYTNNDVQHLLGVNSFLFTDITSNKVVKASFNLDSFGHLYLQGKIKGGKDYKLENLSIDEATNIFQNRIDKIDDDSQTMFKYLHDKMGEKFYKEYKMDYATKFVNDNWINPYDNAVKSKLALLHAIVPNYDEAWKWLLKVATFEEMELTEEEIDSRFSNEREGYVGMYSGDLVVTKKITLKFGSFKFQKIVDGSINTGGFF